MSSLMDHLFPSVKTDKAPIAQEEFAKDIPLPEGEDMPTGDDLLKTLELVNPGEPDQAEVENTPTSATTVTPVHRPSPSRTETVTSNQMTLPAIGEEHLDNNDDTDPHPDSTSTANDLARHETVLESLRSRVRSMESQVKVIPTLDATVKKLDHSSGDVAKKLQQVSDQLLNLQRSFNAYQGQISARIVDVERRAKQGQLRETPPIIETHDVSLPPTDIVLGKSSSITETVKAPKKKVATLSDW